MQTNPLYGHIHGWPAVDIYCVHRIREWIKNTECAQATTPTLYADCYYSYCIVGNIGRTEDILLGKNNIMCVRAAWATRASPARVFAHTAVFVCRNPQFDYRCSLRLGNQPKNEATQNKTTNLFGWCRMRVPTPTLWLTCSLCWV